jgi:HlyD family secretion protein
MQNILRYIVERCITKIKINKMPIEIFPTSITKFSTESLIKKHTTKSKAIYWLLILVVVVFGVSIFYIKVDVNIYSRGIITSEQQTIQIVAPIFGKVVFVKLKENSFVNRGDTLLQIDTVNTIKNILNIQGKIQRIEIQNVDLEYLISLTKKSKLRKSKLNTKLYKQELQKFASDLSYQKSEISIIKKEYIRQTKLYKKQVIPLAEYEQINFKYKNAKLKYNQIFDTQLSAWQKQLNANITEIENLKNNLINLQKEIEKHIVIAPITGYIQNTKGIKEGANIYPNQDICTITPTTNLIVETYVSTSDIGLIKEKQQVKFRVDAFNFNQWGMLKGNVYEIAKDINVNENGIPTFKVRCKLQNMSLTYKSNTVNVKKGMTVNANFFLTRRTLAQLFYDDISDWLNPNVINN